VITLPLSVEERLQFQYILPIQGSIATLETVVNILNKIQVKEVLSPEEVVDIDFEESEMLLMIESVKALDSAGRIHLQSLELAKKILRSK
jgi:hypothetical protein